VDEKGSTVAPTQVRPPNRRFGGQCVNILEFFGKGPGNTFLHKKRFPVKLRHDHERFQ
jgi:hypothetical protein